MLSRTYSTKWSPCRPANGRIMQPLAKWLLDHWCNASSTKLIKLIYADGFEPKWAQQNAASCQPVSCVLGSAMAVCFAFGNECCMRTVLIKVLLSVFPCHLSALKSRKISEGCVFSLAASVISCLPKRQTCCCKNSAALLPGEHDWRESAALALGIQDCCREDRVYLVYVSASVEDTHRFVFDCPAYWCGTAAFPIRPHS